MIEVNLVPDVKQELIKAQRVRSTVVSIAILIALGAIAIVAILGMIIGGQIVYAANQDDRIKGKGTELASTEDLTRMLTIQNQLGAIGGLSDSRTISSRVFGVVNATVPANGVSISRVSMGAGSDGAADQQMVIEGQASGGYPAIEVFKKRVECSVVRYTEAQATVQVDPVSTGDESTDTSTTLQLPGCATVTTDGTSRAVALASDVRVSDTSYGQSLDGGVAVWFRLSFTFAPELFAATSENVTIAVDASGNVTDSYTGVPRSIFENRVTNDQSGGTE